MNDSELKAREAIRDLVARYNLYGDRGRTDRLLELFTPDAWIKVGDLPGYVGREALRALFDGAIRRENAGGAVEPVAHHVSSHSIEFDDPPTAGEAPVGASGQSRYLVLSREGLDHWGRYRDVYHCASGRWLFASRRVSVDGLVPGGWADRNLQAD
ncbi:MAG: nuclear transport factor 2 family protein [Myxococcota bacterium]|jgi:hypothetical protein